MNVGTDLRPQPQLAFRNTETPLSGDQTYRVSHYLPNPAFI